MYYVNVSSIQDFEQCRYRWLCKWVLNRVPRIEGPALAAGKLLHLGFERHAREGLALDQAMFIEVYTYQVAMNEYGVNSPERAVLQKALETVLDLQEAWPLWEDTYPMDVAVLEAEEPFEIAFQELPGVIFRGRPDRVCIMNGSVWHVQNRGLAANMNFATYSRLAKRHKHEHLYAEYLAMKYVKDGEYGGTLFNLVRKLKFRTNVGKKNEKVKTAQDMFWQHPMSINLRSPQHKSVMRDMFYHVEEMQRVEREYRETGRMPAPNDKLNGGFNGSSEDPYFKLLIGETELHDDTLFKDREDTYAVADPGAE
jgi:hypothetical protein